ncbi:hypothetical protein ACF1G5_22065 [Streptomyces coeruleorubidus]|uniref:hypothetical protein n=1 Tax=Streptomyces coeruleorubidus TaxID=116188 RepID=UPI0036FB58DB
MPAEPAPAEEQAGRLSALLGERARQDPDFAAVPEMRRRADAEVASGDVHRIPDGVIFGGGSAGAVHTSARRAADGPGSAGGRVRGLRRQSAEQHQGEAA